MADEQKPGNLAEKLVGNIKNDFTVVGKTRVHAWYAWAIVGIVFGMALGIVYVANRSFQIASTKAVLLPTDPTAPMMAQNSSKKISTEIPGSVTQLINNFEKEHGKVARVTLEEGNIVPGENGRAAIGFDNARDFIVGGVNWLSLAGPLSAALNSNRAVEMTLSRTVAHESGFVRPYLLLGANARPIFDPVISAIVAADFPDKNMATAIMGDSWLCRCEKKRSAYFGTTNENGKTTEVVTGINNDEGNPIVLTATTENFSAIKKTKTLFLKEHACKNESDSATCVAYCKDKNPAAITIDDLNERIDQIISTDAAKEKAKKIAATLSVVEDSVEDLEGNGACQQTVSVTQ